MLTPAELNPASLTLLEEVSSTNLPHRLYICLWLCSSVPAGDSSSMENRRAARGHKRSASQIYEPVSVFTLVRKGKDRREEPESYDGENTDAAVSGERERESEGERERERGESERRQTPSWVSGTSTDS